MDNIAFKYLHCTRKIRHRSEKRAQNVCDTIRNGGFDEVFPYLCKFCGGWHVGHRSNKTIETFKKGIICQAKK